MSNASSLPRHAWRTVCLLWPVALLNYLDRQMLSTMGLSIKKDIVELQSAETYGNLMAVFMWVYAVCSPLGGAIADRISKKWLIVFSLGVWSFVTLMMGHVQGYRELYWLRAVMGVSEAFYIPAGLSLIADYHRGATRSLAVGVHMSGIYLGQALGGLGGWIAQDVSWRTAFQSCGMVGVAYAIVLIAALRDRGHAKEQSFSASSLALPDERVHWTGFVLLMLCFSLPSVPGWAVKNWLPTLLQDRFSLDQKHSGMWATTVAAGAGFLGVLLGGWLSDQLSRRHLRGRTWVSAGGLVLLVPAVAGMGMVDGFFGAVACTAVYGLGFGLFDTNNMPILCQVMPARFRAAGYGLLNCIGIGAGAAVTPLLGRMKDHGISLAETFSWCAVPAFVAAILMLCLSPRALPAGDAVSSH